MVQVLKADGSREEFDSQKVQQAVVRAGATQKTAKEVAEKVAGRLYSGISTKKIFQIAFTTLRKIEPHAASRYDLRNALMRLGPAGYPFETFIARVLEENGYSTLLRQMLQGKCISHEVDVVATKKANASKTNEKLMVECKFHNKAWIKCHIQTALYVYARYLDLCEAGHCFSAPMLATNTKFTDEVLQYAGCKGMKLIGWHCPQGQSLEKMIEAKQLYPVTVLLSGDDASLQRLLQAELVVLKDLISLSAAQLSAKTGFLEEKAAKIIAEAKGICGR